MGWLRSIGNGIASAWAWVRSRVGPQIADTAAQVARAAALAAARSEIDGLVERHLRSDVAASARTALDVLFRGEITLRDKNAALDRLRVLAGQIENRTARDAMRAAIGVLAQPAE